jgi:hypothetical protein|tara:strand:+ start:133 stop:390 length:258 start_codon:yes stop_codon:yes gene_type:complete
MKFSVKWEVEYYDHDKKLYCVIDYNEDDINSIDEIHQFLEDEVNDDKFSPENNVDFYDGDFNIEYIMIYDEDGKIIYKDSDYSGN